MTKPPDEPRSRGQQPSLWNEAGDQDRGAARGKPAHDAADLPLEELRPRSGALPGNKYVRIVRPKGFRRQHHHYVATEEALEPPGAFGRGFERLRRVLFGPRLSSEEDLEQRVGKISGLAVLAPSNISSSAYATEEAMRVLALAGLAALTLTPTVALAVVATLAIIVVSEARVIHAYPAGGGAYVVARDGLGVIPALVAASALLIDYVLTVAVSTAAGVAAISSFVPEIHDQRVGVALGLIALLTIGHLRGLREAGALFAAPTYAYIVGVGALIVYGIGRVVSGDVPAAVPPRGGEPLLGAEALTILLVLRAFSAGAVAITGSEAVANVVPSFRPPERRNATLVLLVMCGTLAALFAGLSFLAASFAIVPDKTQVETVNSMIARAVLGEGPAYVAIQIVTAVFLLFAANTGFSGFPRFAAVLANDRFMPRHFADVGERLGFSFGIIAVAVIAGAILALFGGSVVALVPLYVTAVFLAFTLSQLGLIRRWIRLRERYWRASVVLNSAGLAIIGTALVVVAVANFAAGAWMVLVLVPTLAALLYATNRYYTSVRDALVLTDLDAPPPPPEPPRVVVPIARLDRAAAQAVAFARSISPNVRAVHVATSEPSAAAFEARWERWAGKVPLDTIVSPYRALLRPLIKYIERVDEHHEGPITVVLAEFVPQHWWEFILHSQTTFRIKAALLFRPNTVVIDVPYHFEDTADVPSVRPKDERREH